MAIGQMTSVIRHLRRVVLSGDAGLTDGQLLECFIARRDETAFEALVRRHGPMVLSVCRRVLRNVHDAEDAFQATFLVLVRKADAVVVMCDLEGKSRKEAARQLGLAEGTVSSRLARARALLARRLRGRGAALTGAALIALLARNAASACVPAPLVANTVKAAASVAAGKATAGLISVQVAALTEGVLKTMLLSKLNIVAVLLLAASVVSLGMSVLSSPAQADKPAPTRPKADKASQSAKGEKGEKKEGGKGGKKGHQKPDERNVQGTVKAVDAGKNTITILPAEKQASERTFTLAENLKIFVEQGKKHELARPADLIPGTEVQIRLAEDKKTVVRMSARGPRLYGAVKTVDAGKITIALADKTADKTFPLGDGVRVNRPDGKGRGAKGERGKLEDLAAGMLVSLQLAMDQQKVLEIELRMPTFHVGVEAYDPGKNTLTLTMQKGQAAQTFSVSKDVRLGAEEDDNRAEPSLKELTKGTPVVVQLSVDGKTVARIHFLNPSLHAMMKSVDKTKGTITVTVKEKGGLADKTFALGKGVQVVLADAVDNREAKLADLEEEMYVVLKLSRDRKTALGIAVHGPTFNGVVKAVSAERGEIVVTVKEDGNFVEKVHKLVKNAQISLQDGKTDRRVKLGELTEGMIVSVRLTVNKEQVVAIHAQKAE